MSQAYIGGAAAVVLTAVLVAVSRRPGKTVLRSTDVSRVVALNRAQMELVQQAVAAVEASRESDGAWTLPATTAERLSLERCLRQAMRSGPDQRLEAVIVAGEWGHRSVLDLLRRGLRDSDSRVVEAAASALENRRGAARPPAPQVARPPRNVARMR